MLKKYLGKLKLPDSLQSKSHLVLFIVVCLLVLLVILQAVFPNTFSSYFSPVVKEPEKLDLLQNPNIAKFDFGSGKAVLPKGWSIAALLSSTSATIYNCIGSSGCRIALVSTTNKPQTVAVAFSTPGELRLRKNLGLAEKALVLKIAGKSTNLSAQYYQTAAVPEGPQDVSEDEYSTLLYQIYGCVNQNLCIHVGPFSFDENTNAAQFTEFQMLLNGLKLEK